MPSEQARREGAQVRVRHRLEAERNQSRSQVNDLKGFMQIRRPWQATRLRSARPGGSLRTAPKLRVLVSQFHHGRGTRVSG
jgi:hypothetical protein